MPLSGEAIRMMNYIDDISTTLRRILALSPTLSAEERKRVGDVPEGQLTQRRRGHDRPEPQISPFLEPASRRTRIPGTQPSLPVKQEVSHPGRHLHRGIRRHRGA